MVSQFLREFRYGIALLFFLTFVIGIGACVPIAQESHECLVPEKNLTTSDHGMDLPRITRSIPWSDLGAVVAVARKPVADSGFDVTYHVSSFCTLARQWFVLATRNVVANSPPLAMAPFRSKKWS